MGGYLEAFSVSKMFQCFGLAHSHVFPETLAHLDALGSYSILFRHCSEPASATHRGGRPNHFVAVSCFHFVYYTDLTQDRMSSSLSVIGTGRREVPYPNRGWNKPIEQWMLSPSLIRARASCVRQE